MSFSRRQFSLGLVSAMAAPTLSRLAFAAPIDRPIMPIPAVRNAKDGWIHLRLQEGKWAFDGKNPVSTWGFSQNYLGPVVRARRGAELPLHYENTLNEYVAVHGHGLHVIGELDGGPQRTMLPGTSWKPIIPIAQEAATLWYHSHTHAKTGPQVYKGLAGMMIIDDDNTDKLPLPNRYGVDDIPFIVQDKDFKPSGELDYNRTGLGRFYGEHMMVNGVIEPKAIMPKGLVRLRILNGSNGRFFNFTFEDNRSFIHIATDGGMLEAPVESNKLFMAPGERNEILVDFSDGLPTKLLSVKKARSEENYKLFDPLQGEQTICHFEVDTSIPIDGEARVPSKMNVIERLDPAKARVTRHFTLRDMKINGESMDMRVINHRVKQGDIEIWDIEGDLHNFHTHGCSFQVLSMNGKPPEPGNNGWKDTVLIDLRAKFIVQYSYTAPDKFPYMYHCHLLEHEDMGMMGQFTVHA